MGKLFLLNVYNFCKSQCVINVRSPYNLHGIQIYILYLYDQMWLVGKWSLSDNRVPLSASDNWAITIGCN